jgi:addiction module HigA family antidote
MLSCLDHTGGMSEKPTPAHRSPSHPGALMREIIEEHARLSVTDVARRMGVSRQALHAVLRGRSAVSADMALRAA